MEHACGCGDVGVGGQQHGVKLAGNKTRGSLASSEPFIYIVRRRSKEQNKCQTCRCANKLKLEQEKKKICYILSTSASPQQSLWRNLYSKENCMQSVLPVNIQRMPTQVGMTLLLLLTSASQHQLQEPQNCPKILKHGERIKTGSLLDHIRQLKNRHNLQLQSISVVKEVFRSMWYCLLAFQESIKERVI